MGTFTAWSTSTMISCSWTSSMSIEPLRILTRVSPNHFWPVEEGMKSSPGPPSPGSGWSLPRRTRGRRVPTTVK